MHEHEHTNQKALVSWSGCASDEIKLSPQLVEDQGFRPSLVERISREIGPLYKLFDWVIDEK